MAEVDLLGEVHAETIAAEFFAAPFVHAITWISSRLSAKLGFRENPPLYPVSISPAVSAIARAKDRTSTKCEHILLP